MFFFKIICITYILFFIMSTMIFCLFTQITFSPFYAYIAYLKRLTQYILAFSNFNHILLAGHNPYSNNTAWISFWP